MIELDSPLQNTIFMFLTIMIIILQTKPKPLFDENGKIQSFGCGENKTLLSLHLVAGFTSLLLYILFTGLKVINVVTS